jgi:hypothetical protein
LELQQVERFRRPLLHHRIGASLEEPIQVDAAS